MIMFILAGAAGVSLISKLVSGSFNPLNMIDLTPKGEFRDTNPPLTAAQQQAVIANIANATRKFKVGDRLIVSANSFLNPGFPPAGADMTSPIQVVVIPDVSGPQAPGFILVQPTDPGRVGVQTNQFRSLPESSVVGRIVNGQLAGI
jgi:hypothetical protein